MEPTIVWRDAHADSLSDVPAALKRWILLDTSMTAELRRCCRADVAVRVLRQGRADLFADERELLRTGKGRGAVREVAMQAGAQALLAARSVHVSQRLVPHLRALGTRPLGAWLFGAGRPDREARQLALLPSQGPLARLARQAAGRTIGACWARRSLYRIEGQRLLVTEIFLPAMPGQPLHDSPHPTSHT